MSFIKSVVKWCLIIFIGGPLLIGIIGAILMPSEEEKLAEMTEPERAAYLAAKAAEERQNEREEAARREAEAREYMNRPENIRKAAINATRLDFEWRTELDAFMKADFTIINTYERPIKDIEITCEHFANSGTNIDSNTRVIYEKVASGTTKKFRDFDMGFIHSQARRSICKITNLKVI